LLNRVVQSLLNIVEEELLLLEWKVVNDVGGMVGTSNSVVEITTVLGMGVWVSHLPNTVGGWGNGVDDIGGLINSLLESFHEVTEAEKLLLLLEWKLWKIHS
jgi:hypothetical protein